MSAGALRPVRGHRGLVAAILVGLALAGGILWLSSNPRASSGPTGPTPPGQQAVTAPPANVPMTHARRRAIDATLDAFVPSAVARRDPAASYRLATPSMRAGTTRAEWASGQVPVSPFPAAGRSFDGWSVIYAYPGQVGVSLHLQPRAGSNVGGITYTVVLRRIGARWLVDAFEPAAFFAPSGTTPRVTAQPDFGPHAQGISSRGSSASAWWLLLPLVVLAPVLVLGIVILVRWPAGRWPRRARPSGLAGYYDAMRAEDDDPVTPAGR